MPASASQHSFLGLSNCPVNVPVHAIGLGLVACSLYHSCKVYSQIKANVKGTAVQMPVAFDFYGRPAIYAHPCIGAALYPTLILLQSGAECGYGMFREATANAKKGAGAAGCPLSGCERGLVELLFGASIVTLFAQTVAARVIADGKTPAEVEAENAKGTYRYALAPWKIVGPLAFAFLPSAAAVVCRYLHKK